MNNDPKKCKYNRWMVSMGDPEIKECKNCPIKCDSYNQESDITEDDTREFGLLENKVN